MPLLTYTTASIAAGMLAVSASRCAQASWSAARRSVAARGLRGSLQSRLRREAQNARLASELNRQTASTPNAAWRVVEVAEIVDESEDCRSLYLRDPNGAALDTFQPGQFVIVRPALGGSGQPTRCYSLSDSPGQPWWRITVKRQNAPSSASPRQRNGLSVWLHEHIDVGDYLLLNGPSGQFVIDTSATTPIVLMAAGIGITPIISMLKHVLETQPGRSIKVFFQVQDEQHWPFGRMLEKWQSERPALRVTNFFSRASHLPTLCHGRAMLGKFDADTIISALDAPQQHSVYMCGPDAWMSAHTGELINRGIPAAQIHSESFGGSTASGQQLDTALVAPWSLRFNKSGLTLPTSNERSTIWHAAKVNGLELPAACHTGACGSCRLKLKSGSVCYQQPPTAHCADDEVLACIAQPIGDVSVEG